LGQSDEDTPPKPACHGSLVNYGLPATVEVLVTGCQGWPVADTKGRYELAVPPGEWELVATGAQGRGSVGATVLAGKPAVYRDAPPVAQLNSRLP